VLPVVLGGCLLVGAGCADPSEAPAIPSPPSAATSASLAPADDPPGALACGEAVRAVRDATLMNPGVITDITNAAGTADAPIAAAALRLSAAYTVALAAHDKDTEPDAIAAVSGAAAELVELCSDSGLQTAG
jgi:hypothetical protein